MKLKIILFIGVLLIIFQCLCINVYSDPVKPTPIDETIFDSFDYRLINLDVDSDISSNLIILKEQIDKNIYKFTYNFDSNINTNYQFNFKIDKRLEFYYSNSLFNYTLGYFINNNFWEYYYNFSDMVLNGFRPIVSFDNNRFSLILNLISDSNFVSIDPFFGRSNFPFRPRYESFNDILRGESINSGSTKGKCLSISAFLNTGPFVVFPEVDWGKMRYFLYEDIGGNAVNLIGISDEYTTFLGQVIGYKNITFGNDYPFPIIIENKKYFLSINGVAWGSSSPHMWIAHDGLTGFPPNNDAYYKNVLYNDSFPNPLTGETYQDKNYFIGCYTDGIYPSSDFDLLNLVPNHNDIVVDYNATFYFNGTIDMDYWSWNNVTVEFNNSNLGYSNTTYHEQDYSFNIDYDLKCGTTYDYWVNVTTFNKGVSEHIYFNTTDCIEIIELENNTNILNINPSNKTIDFYFCNESFNISFNVNHSQGGWINVTVYFNNTIVYQENETGNRSITFDLYNNLTAERLFYKHNYTFYINSTIGGNSTNISNWVNTGEEVFCSSLAFENTQFGIFIALSLFFFFFHTGYKSEKRSGGSFMLLSAFILFALEAMLTPYLHIGLIILFISPFAIFILFLGIKKQFYPVEKDNPEAEVKKIN